MGVAQVVVGKIYFMLYLIIAFLVQEPISSSISVGMALRSGTSSGVIFAIYLACTIFDILVGYKLGEYVLHKRKDSRLKKFVDGAIAKLFPHDVQRHKEMAVFLLGTMVFPVTGLLMPSLKISLPRSILILTLSGIILWYGPIFAIAIGFFNSGHLGVIHLLLFVPLLLALIYRLSKKL